MGWTKNKKIESTTCFACSRFAATTTVMQTPFDTNIKLFAFGPF